MNKNKTHYFLCGYIIVFFFLCLCGTGLAQEKSQKKTTYEQAYLDAKPYILKPAPRIPTTRPSIRAWLDDEHYFSHRVMDDNVHLQNSVQLIDKLIDLGKKFEFML